jgi:hypothetical protein
LSENVTGTIAIVFSSGFSSGFFESGSTTFLDSEQPIFRNKDFQKIFGKNEFTGFLKIISDKLNKLFAKNKHPSCL